MYLINSILLIGHIVFFIYICISLVKCLKSKEKMGFMICLIFILYSSVAIPFCIDMLVSKRLYKTITISEVISYNINKFAPNKFLITTSNGEEYFFYDYLKKETLKNEKNIQEKVQIEYILYLL